MTSLEIFTLTAYPDKAAVLPKMKYQNVMFMNRVDDGTIFYLGSSRKKADMPHDGRGIPIEFGTTQTWYWNKKIPDTSYFAIASNRKEGAEIICMVMTPYTELVLS